MSGPGGSIRALVAGLDVALVPVDWTRARLLRWTLPVTRPLLRDRELRLGIAGAFSVCVALATTLLLPFWALALGPLLLGVPHLVADIRYLVVRPGLHRRPALWLGIGLPIALAYAGGNTAAGLLAGVGAFAFARGSVVLRVFGATGMLLLAASAWLAGPLADAVAAQLHNGFAVVLWLLWRPRAKGWHWLPAVLFVAALAFLWTGTADPLATFAAETVGMPPGVAVKDFSSWVAPGAGDWGLRLVLGFAFAQAVHYAVWLRLLPEDNRRRDTPMSARSTWRALASDIGPWGAALVVAVAVALVAWAVFDLTAARLGYLRLALFHAWLEIGAAAVFLVEGFPLSPSSPRRARD